MPPRSRSTAPSAAPDEAARKAAHERASLLTPVAKAFSTDIGIEVASLGVQVHGGMGYIEETGAAQHYRDARIAAIYEGTNGIQAIDLVTRKLPLVGRRGGARLYRRAAPHRRSGQRHQRSGLRLDRRAARRRGREPRRARRAGCSAQIENDPDAALAGATPYLRLFAAAAGGCMLAEQALAALRLGNDAADASRWRASLPRTSRCGRAGSSARWSKARKSSRVPMRRAFG